MCLLTVHGIGFQQPPDDPSRPGYADELHALLRERLHSALGGDPVRSAAHPGVEGPVYVCSEWPPGSGHVEDGLDRLARTLPGGRLDWSERPLAPGGSDIAHVALVYAGLESTRPHLLVGLRALLSAIVRLNRYASPLTLWRLLRRALRAVRPFAAAAPVASRVRDDIPHRHLVRLPRRRPPAPGGSPGDTLVQLEDDVASYVYNRRLRRRVGGFVHDALTRLLARDDVAAVIVNAHSQGTVVCCDTLTGLDADALKTVAGFVTAGSPLRKYVDLFGRARDVAALADVPWLNFWDALDPVADPLAPPPAWRPLTDARLPAGELGLFISVRSGGFVGPARVADILVDNVAHSHGGGLQAHAYWANARDFVPALARVLEEVVASG